MRTGRLKQIKKNINSLLQTGYRSPFNVLADHKFLVSFNSAQMSLKHIESILGSPIKMYTTHCEYKKYKDIVKETRLIGCVDVKKCEHESMRTLECFDTHILQNNPNHYFAAISPKYRYLKENNNLPIIFVRSGVLCVEIGKKHKERIDKSRQPKPLSANEKEVLDKLFS